MQLLNNVFAFITYNVLKGRVILCLLLDYPFRLKGRVAGFPEVGYPAQYCLGNHLQFRCLLEIMGLHTLIV